MLEKIDLTKTVSDKEFNEALPRLKARLSVLQRILRDRKIPTIIVIDGWNTAGITMSTHSIIQSLDPRGFTLHATGRPTEEEKESPFMWSFWIRTPARGRIALFARSWYSRAITTEMQKSGWKKSLEGKSGPINNFERTLTDNGAVIIKFLSITLQPSFKLQAKLLCIALQPTIKLQAATAVKL